MDELTGRVLGPYELIERLGSGGMGAVYLGVHRVLQQPRAIKVMDPPYRFAGRESFVRLFEREARLAARLTHPNIVRIYDVGDQDGLHYIVMERLEGRPLNDVVQRDAPLPPGRAIGLLRQLASALDYAHSQGVAHRDLKPANAFVGPNDHVTLVDFGIARAAEETHLTVTAGIGTPAYMAPESFDPESTGAGPDADSTGMSGDLYALGVVAYELLTGRLPFAGRPRQLLYAILHEPPPPPRAFRPELTPAVEGALLRQINKDPSERFPSAGAFVAALERAAEAGAEPTLPGLHAARATTEPTPRLTPTSTETNRSGRRIIRSRRFLLVPVAVAMLVALGAISLLRQAPPLPGPPSTPEAAQASAAPATPPVVLTTPLIEVMTEPSPATGSPDADATDVIATDTSVASRAGSEPTTGPQTATPTRTEPAVTDDPTPAPTVTTMAVIVSASPSPTPDSRRILLADNFDDPRRGHFPLLSYNQSEFELAYIDGEYSVRNVHLQNQPRGVPVPGLYDDAVVALDVRFIRIFEGWTLMIDCRRQPHDGSPLTYAAYQLRISFISRQITLVRALSGQDVVLIRQQVPTLLKQGTEWNNVEFSCIGNTISAYLNGEEAASVQDSTFQSGQFGVLLGAPPTAPRNPEIRLDNLVVYGP